MNDQQLWKEVSFLLLEGNETFQPLGTSILKLSLTITQVESLDNGIELSIIPNPFNELATLNLKVIRPVMVSAEIFTSTGQSKGYIAKNISVEHISSFQINCTELSLNMGVFYVKVILDDKISGSPTVKTLKFIIL